MTETAIQDARSIIGVSVGMMVLVAIALVLRVFARLKAQRRSNLEEWFIWIAAVLFTVYNGILLGYIANVEAGDTLIFIAPSLSQFDSLIPYIFALGLLFVYCIAVVKISILIFYTHIFAIRSFKTTAYLLIGCCVVWALVNTLLSFLQCNPIAAAWHFEMQLLSTTTCISQLRIIFGSEISNLAIDIAILTLPVFFINRLQLKKSKKISVSLIFLLGGFVCICCAIRMYWVYMPGSLSPRGSTQALHNWSTIELASAIVCACLPTYGPLITGERGITTKARIWHANFVIKNRKFDPEKDLDLLIVGPRNDISSKK